jgi:hypothetical protein
MGPAWLAQLRKVGNQIQLVATDTHFRADGDPGNRIAVREAFSDSLVGSSAVASAEPGLTTLGGQVH